jgi:hypothetical protein
MSMTGHDFYFRVSKRGRKGETSVRHVRLWGDSSQWMESNAQHYDKEGFSLSPSSREEYIESNWRRAAK